MDNYTLKKEFKTYYQATKWVNKQLADLSYKVEDVNIIRPKTPNAPIIAIVVYKPQ